jgi:hypothetical protein
MDGRSQKAFSRSRASPSPMLRHNTPLPPLARAIGVFSAVEQHHRLEKKYRSGVKKRVATPFARPLK